MGFLPENLGERLLWGTFTAIPLTLMSLASCGTYSQFITKDNNMNAGFLAAANFFSASMTVWSTSLLSHTPYTLTSPDMTNNLFIKFCLDSAFMGMKKAQVPDENIHATLHSTLHVASAILGALFVVMGRFQVAIPLTYLPYPVVAGFLACVGLAITKASLALLQPANLFSGLAQADNVHQAMNLMMADLTRAINAEPGYNIWPMLIGIVLACLAFCLKKFNIPTNFTSVMSILLSTSVFYGWYATTNKTMDDLRNEGWLFPAGAQMVAASWYVPLEKIEWENLFEPSALALAFVACINRALTHSGIESAAAGKKAYSVDAEMYWTGFSTLAVGAIGGVAHNPAAGLTLLVKEGSNQDGVTAYIAAIIVTILHFAVWFFEVPLTAYLPRFLLGGLLMMMGVSMLVDWVVGVRRKIGWPGLMVIFAMMAASVRFGLLQAMVFGILVAVIRLNIRLSNLEVLKYHVCGSHLQSGHFYETTRRRILQKYGTNTHIIGVTGFLFEGLTISLGRYLKTVLNTNGNFSSLVLDFFACQGLNESACSQFMKIATFFSEKKKRLFLCHLDKQDEDLLRTWGIESSWVEIVTSLSEVLARLEQETLTGHGAPRPAIDGDTCDMAVLRQSLAQLLGDGPAQEICKKSDASYSGKWGNIERGGAGFENCFCSGARTLRC